MTETVQDSPSRIYELASRKMRFFAAIVDAIIASISLAITYIINYYAVTRFFSSYYEMLENKSISAFSSAAIYHQIIITIVFTAIYFFVNYSFMRNGQTIGMKLLYIQVADVQGKTASIWRMYFLREIIFWQIIYLLKYSFGYILHSYYALDAESVRLSTNLLSSIILTVDLLFIYRIDRRCIHDFFAGTIVIALKKKK
jgi:uncharacterized RDD family membrane protein YckC